MISRHITPRRKGRRFLTAGAAFGLLATSLLAGGTALAVHDEGVFQLDGNAIVDNGTDPEPQNPVSNQSGTQDWDLVAAGTDSAENTAFVEDTTLSGGLAGAGDSILTGGATKDINDIGPSWLWKETAVTSVQDKDDIEHAYAAQYKVDKTDDGVPPAEQCGTSGPTADCILLYFGADRFSNSGDAVMGFWFFKSSISTNGPDANGNGTFTGNHTARDGANRGDILIVADFRVGGKAPSIQVYEWVASGGSASTHLNLIGGGPNPASCTQAPPEKNNGTPIPPVAANDNFCATANQFIVQSPWPFTAKANSGGTSGDGGSDTKFGVAEFMEGGINMTALGLGNTCFSTFLAETRSSHSVTSTLSDFTLGGFGSCESGITTTPSDENGDAIGSGGIDLGTDGTVNVTDSADITVTGTNQWDATVDFYLCGPDATTCDDTGTLVSSHEIDETTTMPLVSDPAEVTAAGDYCWAGIFTSHTDGVPDDSDVSSGECFAVNPVDPTISTNADDTAVLGDAIDDTATLGGTANQPGDPVINPTTAGGAAGGTITFNLYGPSDTADCTTDPIGTSVVDVTGDGDYKASDGTITGTLTPSAVGTYWWVASYSGDEPNTNPVSGSCGDTDESTTITGNAALTTAQDWLPNDTATITGDTDLSGSVTFILYTGSDCNDGEDDTEVYNSGAIAVSGASPQTPSTSNTNVVVQAGSGPYSWLVTYTDDNLSSPAPTCETTTITIDDTP